MVKLLIRKVGNHWYPCINHELGDNIGFNKKIDRYLEKLDFSNSGEVTIELEELNVLWDGLNIIYFHEEDIVRFLTTNDDFNMRFVINNHKFEISSTLYWLLEEQFNLNLHDTGYRIHVL